MIALTKKVDGSRILINIDEITSVHEWEDGGCVIELNNHSEPLVNESIKTVSTLISNARLVRNSITISRSGFKYD